MAYGYLILVVLGLAGASTGFVLLGRRRFKGTAAGFLLLLGFVLLVMGILLTCVPDFFRG